MSEQLARKWFDQGKLPAARTMLEPFFRAGRLSNDGMFMYGVCTFRLHDIRGALDVFTTLSQRDSRNAPAHYYVGLCEERLEHGREAWEAYNRALALQPTMAEARDKVQALASVARAPAPSYAGPATSAPSGPPAGPAGRPRRGRVRGQVRNLQGRGGTRFKQTLSFRLVEPSGSVVEVTMTGTGQVGSINEGDWVEVRNRRRKGLIQADEVLNLTTGARVRYRGEGCLYKTLLTLVVLFLLAGGAALAFAILSSR